jgi:ABC-type antimicrobial peptide transport system permease subunit
MALPLKYNLGNLAARKMSNAMTIFGIGIVIAVMVSMMALYAGVETALVSSGSAENVMVLREGALTEATSWVDKDKFRIIRALPGIAAGPGGAPLVSPELLVLFKLAKKDDPKGSNVNVRGVTPAAFAIRPHIRLVEGRMFRRGVAEVIVSRRARRRFVGLDIGQSFRVGTGRWTVVGVFDAQGTSFDSEIWADADYLGLAQRREQVSTVIIRPQSAAAAAEIKSVVESDNRLKLKVKTEKAYYDEQTVGLIGIKILVRFVTFFMVIGAALGTMNAMFSSVDARKRELATLRALGFRRRSILLAVVIESSLISLSGGLVGLLLALPINGISTGTTNFQTFSEVAFSFRISPEVVMFALGLSLFAGVMGGLIPAVRAARLPITTALREV